MTPDPAFDVAALWPGETVADPAVPTAPDGTRPAAAIVYPLGLVHLATHAPEVDAVYGLLAEMQADPEWIDPADAAARLADVLLARAPRLLADCTAPPVTDPATPLARAAAASWVRQSLGHELEPERPPEPPADGEAPTPPRSLRAVLAGLVASGHRLRDVLHERQPGPGGHPFPYPGWSLRQVSAWADASTSARFGDHAVGTADLVAAIAGTFGGDEGRRLLKEHVAALGR